MSVRDYLQKNGKAGAGIAAGMVALSAVLVVYQAHPQHGMPPGVSANAFYTTEDQLTGDAALNALFVDSVNRAPPFDHDGKPAYLAAVYSCNGGRVRWVNSLRRYSAAAVPKVQALIDAALATNKSDKVDASAYDNQVEAKRPGTGSWVSARSPGYSDACLIVVPDNARADDLMPSVP